MKKVLPLLLALLGLGAGAGAGIALRPEPEIVEINPCGDVDEEMVKVKAKTDVDEDHSESEFVKINNQFVIPVVKNDKVTSLVVMSLSLEVAPDNREAVYLREPKLRDEFLQVMFNHANNGGFDGVFTQTSRLTNLRRASDRSRYQYIGQCGLQCVGHKYCSPGSIARQIPPFKTVSGKRAEYRSLARCSRQGLLQFQPFQQTGSSQDDHGQTRRLCDQNAQIDRLREGCPGEKGDIPSIVFRLATQCRGRTFWLFSQASQLACNSVVTSAPLVQQRRQYAIPLLSLTWQTHVMRKLGECSVLERNSQKSYCNLVQFLVEIGRQFDLQDGATKLQHK